MNDKYTANPDLVRRSTKDIETLPFAMEGAASARTAPDVVVDRRRPGRAEYTNPHLIALLRRQDGVALPPKGGQDVSLPEGPAGSAFGLDDCQSHRQPASALDQSSLHLLTDGKAVRSILIDGDRHIFVVPRRFQTIQLAYRHNVAVVKVVSIMQSEYDVIPADHPGLVIGWGPSQRQGQSIWRWTEGPATLPITAVPGTIIEVYLRPSLPADYDSVRVETRIAL